MATIRDVAQRAGVSVGTVSRVISKNETVTSEMRHLVQAAIEELDYRPNLIARSLRSAKTRLIALVVPDITNPHFSELAFHMESAAAPKGYTTIVANTHGDPQLERRQIAELKSRYPAGLLIVPAGSDYQAEDSGRTRIIAIDRPYGEHLLVAADHFAGGRLAASHLVGLGHRRVAFVSGPTDLSVSQDRKRGFMSVFEEAGISPSPEIVEGGFDLTLDEAALSALLLRPSWERPTGIATSNDQQAIRLIRMARDYGITVPRDLSVVGFDDIPFASLTIPRLTTISQPIQKIAEAAMAALLDPDQTESVIFPPSIRQRETSLPIEHQQDEGPHTSSDT